MKMNLLAISIVTVAFIKIATSQPSLRWNKRSKNFEVISELLSRETEIKKVSKENKQPILRNFNGQPLRISYFERHGVFEYYDNDTKVKGLFGEIWTTVCNFLNFTMVLSKSTEPSVGYFTKNGTYTGVMKKAGLNETDVVPRLEMYSRRLLVVEFSTGFWMQSLRMYSRGNWKQNPTWMLNIFTRNVWIAIIAFLVASSIASAVTQRILIRYRGKNLETEGILNHLFYNFSMLCNQTDSPSKKAGSGSNLLNVIIVLFAYLTIVAYNSNLIFSLTRESSVAPFTDIDTLMDKTEYHIIVLNGSDASLFLSSTLTDNVVGRVKRSPRLKVVEHVNDLYSYVCKQPDKYVFLDLDDEVAIRTNMECDVEPIGYEYYPALVASGFSYGFQAKETINFWLVKFREFGLLDAIKKRFMAPAKKKTMVRRSASLTIGMDHVLVIFGILCLGMIGSIIICIVENIIFTIKQPKPAELTVKKMSNFEQLSAAESRLQNRLQGRYLH